MTKIEIFPIKICVRKEEGSNDLESIMTVTFRPDEESFKSTETPPNINIDLLVESDKENDIDYICNLGWFEHFFARTGIGDLLTRVNFACNINVREGLEFSEESKEKLNAAFGVFVSRLQAIINDRNNYFVMWAQTPLFTVTLGSADEKVPEEEPHSEAVEDGPKSD